MKKRNKKKQKTKKRREGGCVGFFGDLIASFCGGIYICEWGKMGYPLAISKRRAFYI
jgi:hypothetical protein